jgi:hypothetical protein
MPGPTPIKSSTQQNIDIEEIMDNMVLLKDGSASLIITTTAVNFGLLSESEQDATIYAYAALLNSLTFPIQVLIRSNRKDISGYERLLSEQEARSPKPENKERIRKYREFIEETVRQRNVLDKKFYIVIPFSVLELGVAKSATAIAKSGSKGLPFPKEYILSRAKMTLEPKRDHLLHQLSRLGLRARQLSTKELIQLLFEIYNPVSSQGQMLASPEEYTTPIVQPDVAFQEAPQIEIPTSQKKMDQTPPTSNRNVQTESDKQTAVDEPLKPQDPKIDTPPENQSQTTSDSQEPEAVQSQPSADKLDKAQSEINTALGEKK